MYHTKWAKKKDLNFEKSVLENADKSIVVSADIKQLLNTKIENQDKVVVIPNGYDHEDFSEIIYTPVSDDSPLKITYTGSISDDYPSPFFH